MCIRDREDTLRLHILANSDSEADQELKLAVRDAILQACLLYTSYNPAVMKSIYKASGLLAVCERHGALAYTACEAAPRKTDGVRVKEDVYKRQSLDGSQPDAKAREAARPGSGGEHVYFLSLIHISSPCWRCPGRRRPASAS